jgi:hypothetical protein
MQQDYDVIELDDDIGLAALNRETFAKKEMIRPMLFLVALAAMVALASWRVSVLKPSAMPVTWTDADWIMLATFASIIASFTTIAAQAIPLFRPPKGMRRG